jgi:CRISPR-associated protein Cmr2
MNRLTFWKQKIVQAFHDPPAKPYAWYPGTGGHWGVSKELYGEFTGKEFKRYHGMPDWAAAGADRPLLAVPKGKKGPVQVHWPSHPIVTHPLAQGYVFDVQHQDESEPEARAELRKELLEDELEVAQDLGKLLDDWQDEKQLQHAFIRHWRLFREALASNRKGAKTGDPVWELMPADSRSPDHSIWDHLRVTTALAFLTSEKPSEAQTPWLFKFTVGPVQRFIQESRTSRDLWVSSFLFSDLVFYAMKPFIDHYGPDCIVYPDLRGNPRADCWLAEEVNEALPEDLRNPGTFAAVLPNTFTALIHRGGADYLVPIEDLAQEARESVLRRWKDHAETVRHWLKGIVSSRRWEAIWERQHKNVIHTYWSAVAWEKPEKIELKESLRGRALPAQRPGFREPEPEDREKAGKDREAISERRERLAPWVNREVWSRYEWAREVYAYTNLNMHQMERGFDYALTHHQLGVRHTLRKATSPDTLGMEEPGEKCSLCGRRQALVADPGDSAAAIDISRRSARNFWAFHKDLDPERTGAERLCAVCTMKRFLVAAGSDPENNKLKGINPLWAGISTTYEEVKDSDGKIRLPFPSTAMIACQEYLKNIVEDSKMAAFLRDVADKAQRAGLPRTNFPRSLPKLAAFDPAASQTAGDFLEFDVQNTLFPETVDGLTHGLNNQNSNGQKKEALQALRKSVLELRNQAKKCGHGDPKTHFAVIRMDGDHMGRLLLGDEEMMDARWTDVLHPEAVKKIYKSDYMGNTGWIDLLEAKRLMGPSLHAFISRALAEFSHRFVPWVVEQEFSGRLIYSGGDDVLCLAPAEEALSITSRLQQLFSSPWIIDTDYQEDPWLWRRKGLQEKHDPERARQRLVIPLRPPDDQPIRLPIRDPALLEPYVVGQQRDSFHGEINGRLFPMLGPGCSLSAGIAYGHFKTPMSRMLIQAGHLLNDLAKEKCNRKAVALGHFSRNGVKTEFAMKWINLDTQREAVQDLETVIEAFRKKTLPAGLPYKLRLRAEAASSAFRGSDATLTKNEHDRLLRGLFDRALEVMEQLVKEAAFSLWNEGIKLFPKDPARSVEGLLLARTLAGLNGGES